MATMEPTPEQFAEWLAKAGRALSVRHPAPLTGEIAGEVARLAYAAGADAELEACCEWMEVQERLPGYLANDLRKARRPKPLSLKQQAEEELQSLQQEINKAKLGLSILHGSIGRAIESLPDD
jgi:hypothetical protein